MLERGETPLVSSAEGGEGGDEDEAVDSAWLTEAGLEGDVTGGQGERDRVPGSIPPCAAR